MSSARRRRRAALAAVSALLAVPASASAASTTVQAEHLALPAANGMTTTDAGAEGGRGLLIWSNGAATGTVTTQAARRVAVRVRGDQCSGAPRVALDVDGRRVLTADVAATSWTTIGADVALGDGSHAVSVAFTNDAVAGGCDRNLHVDSLSFSSTAAAPLAGARLWVDPNSAARRQADAWRTTRPGDASQMDRIAGQAQAAWFGGWSGDVRAAVDARVSAAAASGAVPVLVAYNVPQRDCGSHSAGGAGSADAYRSWIRAFAAGIGTRRAVVVVEPDAIAQAPCLSAADQETRYALLRDAVAVLAARPGAQVYLDAGHARWLSVSDAAARLRRAGLDNAQGFSLNVSNFLTTEENLAYARALSTATGDRHFVIDTSRNGLGPDATGEWCNPRGRALGLPPTTNATTDGRFDARLWVKTPGESDGACSGGPSAGTWWPEEALGLAQRARW